ncbi:unnamed protein product [Brassicogethes aeneus]|uniref:Uncharacterized protein n=1 Tax=Brassicogethes aeneus TaxID=1431903 RepID=A0A9P0AVX3_BRAAE|nr:unnamed protein product [Brassicogethes aeneus]
MEKVLILFFAISQIACDVSHILLTEELSTIPPPPKPYAFGYAAGRFPGHIDRTHSEVSDGAGNVQGSYSYVDPRHQIRTVEYTADKNGFHPILNKNQPDLPSDSKSVFQAKQRHYEQYNAIALQHQSPQILVVPRDSVAVHNAKNRHYTLFEKIAADHARIAAEREALRLASKNTLEDHY